MDIKAILEQPSAEAALEMLANETAKVELVAEGLATRLAKLENDGPTGEAQLPAADSQRLVALEQFASHGAGLCQSAHCTQCGPSRELLIHSVADQVKTEIYKNMQAAAVKLGFEDEARAMADVYEQLLAGDDVEDQDDDPEDPGVHGAGLQVIDGDRVLAVTE